MRSELQSVAKRRKDKTFLSFITLSNVFIKSVWLNMELVGHCHKHNQPALMAPNPATIPIPIHLQFHPMAKCKQMVELKQSLDEEKQSNMFSFQCPTPSHHMLHLST